VLRRVILSLLAVLSALGLAVAGRVAWVGYGPPPGDSVSAAQVRFLQRSIAAGDGARMQRRFRRPWWPAFADPFLLPLVALIAVSRRGRRT
jgi:hypothetical protein